MSDVAWLPDFKGETKTGKSEVLLVLQNCGMLHVLHPEHNKPIQECVIHSGCKNGKIAISQEPLVDQRGYALVIANETGSRARSYK